MASQILENDFMFSANGIRPWHGLGAIVDEAPTSEDAIKIAKLDWKVEKLPLYIKRGKQTIQTDRNGLVRLDTNYCMGVVKDRYEIVQNVDAFNFVDDIMASEKGAVRYETAGSLFNGKKVFLLVRMPDSDLLGDTIENYLFFTNGHDGFSSVKAGISNVRVVCDNTLQMAMKGATRTWSAPHTRTVKQRQAEAIHSLKLATTYIREMPKFAESLFAKKLNVDKIVPTFFTKTELETTKTQDAVYKIIALAKGKDDLQNFKGTAWGIYSAVADFISHPTGKGKFRSPDRQMDAFLTGNVLLGKAQKVLLAA